MQEENNKQLEQPKNIFQNSQGEEVSQDDVRAEIEENLGSNFGKFKDAKTLFDSYNKLQTDYTKKCQALSTLQKKVNSEQLPPKEELEAKAKDFFEKNQEAKYFSKDIFETLSQDKEVLKKDNPFDIVWTEYLRENFKAPQTLINDEKFLQTYVLNNQEIKSKILSDYFKNINFNEAPTLISAQKGSKSILTPPSKPKSLKEASDLVRDMFD